MEKYVCKPLFAAFLVTFIHFHHLIHVLTLKKTSKSFRTFKYDASVEFLLGDSINLDLVYDFDIRQLLRFETNLFILFYVEKSKVIPFSCTF